MAPTSFLFLNPRPQKHLDPKSHSHKKTKVHSRPPYLSNFCAPPSQIMPWHSNPFDQTVMHTKNSRHLENHSSSYIRLPRKNAQSKVRVYPSRPNQKDDARAVWLAPFFACLSWTSGGWAALHYRECPEIFAIIEWEIHVFVGE